MSSCCCCCYRDQTVEAGEIPSAASAPCSLECDNTMFGLLESRALLIEVTGHMRRTRYNSFHSTQSMQSPSVRASCSLCTMGKSFLVPVNLLERPLALRRPGRRGYMAWNVRTPCRVWCAALGSARLLASPPRAATTRTRTTNSVVVEQRQCCRFMYVGGGGGGVGESQGKRRYRVQARFVRSVRQPGPKSLAVSIQNHSLQSACRVCIDRFTVRRPRLAVV